MRKKEGGGERSSLASADKPTAVVDISLCLASFRYAEQASGGGGYLG